MKTNNKSGTIWASAFFSLNNKNIAAILAAILYGALSLQVSAKTIVVSSLADPGPKTLRAALGSANDGDTIRINAKGTIYLNSGALIVTKDIEILGPGN